ncbi:putative helicase senataxin [Calliopsis andreniformis]|uniref:putative helicase senataxin n=1 Tax=Calliopsis andreniformis TaxID=337506 RepID=UPI003FCE229C
MGAEIAYNFVLERINGPHTIVLDRAAHNYTCGRGQDNDIICLSLTVSRRHCIFFHNKTELYVTDLKSANGVFINGILQKPYNAAKIQSGDIIGIGCPNVNARDNTMFVYRMHVTPIPPMKSDYDDSNSDLLGTTENVPISLECTSSDRSDAIVKRKREKNSDSIHAAKPTKIRKLNKEGLKTVSSKGEHKAADENDIEIVHISLNNALEQSNNNCDNTPIRAELDETLNKNRITYIDMIKMNNDTKDQHELPMECKIECNELTNPKKVQSIQSHTIIDTSDVKEEKPFINRNTECVNEETFQSGQKSTESNLSDSKDKENSHNSCNIPRGKKKKNSNRKVTAIKENTNSSEKSSNSSSDFLNKLKNVENGTTESNLLQPSSITKNEDFKIKLEDELQLTDTDEEAIWNSSNMNNLPLISPLKLKKVQQEPKTNFSEVDIVNLSDDEDDIFPCSQLFDIGFGMDTSVKQEVKEELKEESNEIFNTLDDADLVISLSDSEDDDKDKDKWLRRLSRSQLLNENDETDTKPKDHKEEVMDVEIIDIEDQLYAPDTIEDEPTLFTSTKDKAQEDKESTGREEQNEEDDENALLQDVTNANEMCFPGPSTDRMDMDSEDDALNSVEPLSSHTESIVNNKKSTSLRNQDLDPKDQEIENHISVPVSSRTKETSTIEEPRLLPMKKKSLEKKVPEIEPPYLPVRRRSRSSTRVQEVSEKLVKKKLTAKEKNELKKTEKLEQYSYEKEQKKRRQLHKWAECLPPSKTKPTTCTSLTKEKKEELVNNRKLKLKQLALDEKRSHSENNQEKKRTSTKPKAKISTKTRFDCLVEDTLSATKVDETKDKAKPSTNRSKVTTSTSPNVKTVESKTNKDASKDITLRLKSSLTLTDISSLGKIPKKSSATKEKACTTVETVSEDTILANAMKKGLDIGKKETALKNKSTINSLLSANTESSSCLKSSLKSPASKPKRRVSFSTNIRTVHEYQIDESNVLKKLQGKKDAPLPVPLPRPLPSPASKTKVNEFLHRIFSWNPVWLEEQLHLDKTPPVVDPKELHVTLTHYKSYNEYYDVTAPLLLLETWYGITKQFQNLNDDSKRRTLMYSVVENSIQTNMVSTNIYFTTLMVEILFTREDMQRQAYPANGDLVFFEYVKNHGKGQTFRKVFAYITNMCQRPLTPTIRYNKDLQNYVRNPHTLITYTLLTKSLEKTIPVNRVQRLRAICNLRSIMRQVQALEYLPKSPIASLILNPKIDMYQLPPKLLSEPLISKDKLNEKQLEAVLKVTETIVQKQPKLCFIQGPPGTGKSKVIVNIVTQVLYGNQRYTSKGSSLRILVCAPSNAAIDEITKRLLDFRSTMKHNRLKMVRIGRTDMMHPRVREISVVELAKREVKRTTVASTNIPLDSVEEEISLLESKMNAIKCQMNERSASPTHKRNLIMKLNDIEAKYDLLKHRRPVNEMNPKLQRAAVNRVLAHADVITCTLSSCYNNQMESVFVSNRKISVCIVDEATQSCEPETLIPLMLGVNTLVLVGDPNQLPATVLSPMAKQLGLDRSIFSRVQSAFEYQWNSPIITLDTQYRMQHEIAFWPNKFFYGGNLKTSILQNEKFPFYPYRILNLNTYQSNDNNSNTDEAEFVVNMIYSMLTYSNLDKLQSLSLGILTPYNDQKPVIQKKINEKVSLLPENINRKINIDINTVDGFQGQERDVIIMSCVRSQRIGFLSDRQRLCVALTRAKHSLILCGNFNVFMKDIMWNTLLSDAQNRKVYIDVKANAEPQEIVKHVVRERLRTKKR